MTAELYTCCVTFTVAFVYMKLGWKTHVFDKKGGINVGN